MLKIALLGFLIASGGLLVSKCTINNTSAPAWFDVAR